MYSWSVNTSIIYYHQFSHFVLHCFTLCSDMRNYNTAASLTGKLFKPSFRTILYGKKSITLSAVNAWNKIQTAFGDVILKNLTITQHKNLLTKKSIDKY